jgi:ADP-dependent phosphofructokinase/glucokinase
MLYLVVENNVQTLKRITMEKFNRKDNDVKLCLIIEYKRNFTFLFLGAVHRYGPGHLFIGFLN